MNSSNENTVAANPATAEGAATKSEKGMSRKWLYGILILAFLFVLMPYLFWQMTWFGRPLNDAGIAKAFGDENHPREAQHALSQLADRMLSSDANARASARKWYPQVVAMAASPSDELRLTAAWVMQQDNSVPEFHTALVKLLSDNNAMVSRNAALALVRFNDAAGHEVIFNMLEPAEIAAPASGKLVERAGAGDAVNAGAMIGRIESDGHGAMELRTNSPGTFERWNVANGTSVASGAAIAVIDASSDEVWEALRALYIIGKPSDESTIEIYTHSVKGMAPRIREQAKETLGAIRAHEQQVPPAK
jgi:biotin carboxyl carrier protein